jgi:hypothetical protein
MAYIPSAKALVFGRDIAAALALRLPEETVVSAFSAVSGLEGAPVISIKASGGNVDALIRIEQVGTPAKDILGLAQTVFTPHICKLIIDSDVSLLKYTQLLTAAGGECILHGIKLEVYAAASAAEGGLIAGNLKATFDSIQYPLLSTL